MLPENLVELLGLSDQHYCRRVALVFGQKKITYGQLNAMSNSVAAGLKSLGLREGERIAIMLDNCPEFVIAYFAILKIGATVVPVNHMFKADEAKFILEDSQARALITSASFGDLAQELNLRLDSLKYLITTTFLHQHPEFINLNTWMTQPQNDFTPYPASREDLAVILYTSGTTGKPKGAVLTHKNLVSNVYSCQSGIRINRNDTFICVLPLFHSFAATVCMLLPICAGARIVIMKSVRPFRRVLRAIRKNRVTVFVGIPSFYNILKDIKFPRFLPAHFIKLFNPVRICISGAAALPVETWKKFEAKFRIPLLEGYGLTEASPVVSMNPVKGLRKAGSIGLPLKDVEVRIIDEKDKILGPNEAGELLVKGPNVMKGYFNHPQETAEDIKNGWLYTGDIAKIDTDGYIYIVDRKKDMVNVRGLNVYPREIEEALYQHPKVKEAAVVGINDPRKGEVPLGFVVLKEGVAPCENELITFLRQHLANYKVPHHIEFRDTLPKNTTGKILKHILRAAKTT